MKKIIGKTLLLLLVLLLISTYLYAKYPVSYNTIISRHAEEFGLDPYLVASIINVESRYDRYAQSSKDARGLMQISPQTGLWASQVMGLENYSPDLLYDPDTNIRIGSWYLARLYKEFDGDLDLVLAAYNGGSGNVAKWLGDSRYSDNGKSLKDIPFEETKNYLARVEENYQIYSRLYRLTFKYEAMGDWKYIDMLHRINKALAR